MVFCIISVIPLCHGCVTVNWELMSSDGIQPSLKVSTLNRDILQLVGQQWWPSHCPSLPGFQLRFSYIPSYSRASTLLLRPCAGNPLHPTSTGYSHVCHPLLLHVSTSSVYFTLFLSKAFDTFIFHARMSFIVTD